MDGPNSLLGTHAISEPQWVVLEEMEYICLPSSPCDLVHLWSLDALSILCFDLFGCSSSH